MTRIHRRTVLTLASAQLALSCATSNRSSAPFNARLESGTQDDDTRAQDPQPTVSERTFAFSWVSAQQLVEPNNHPPIPLRAATLRQRVLLTVGGERIRVGLSNEYGKEALEIRRAHLAFPTAGADIEPNTAKPLLFDGAASTTIPPGRTTTSDVLELSVPQGSEFAMTLEFGEVPEDVTGHPGSRTTSFLTPQADVAAARFDAPVETDHWYFINGVEVSPADDTRALVILGDSITDGRGSTTNENDRYPNVLARRYAQRKEGPRTAVLNQGIGGNRVLRDGLGPTVLERYERDALAIPGATAVLLFAGINDLGALHGKNPNDPDRPRAQDLIAAFSKIAKDTRARGIRIFAATLLPFEGSFYFTDEGERERQALNDWIRSTKELDGFVDFDVITRDEKHPSRLSRAVDGGDHLHPSADGYQIMGNAIDLELFD